MNAARPLQDQPLQPPQHGRSRYRVGARVKIRPEYFGRDWAIRQFGSGYKDEWMYGTVVREGTRTPTTRGSGPVWRVCWDLDQQEDEHARSFLRLATLARQPRGMQMRMR